MFSSNQKLEISGELNFGESLYQALKFGLERHGGYAGYSIGQRRLIFQIVKDKYYVGYIYHNMPVPEGWQEYQFDFSDFIVAQIIEQFLQKQEYQHEDAGDGSYNKGFLMKAVPEYICFGHDGEIKNPIHAILVFEPYTVFYSK